VDGITDILVGVAGRDDNRGSAWLLFLRAAKWTALDAGYPDAPDLMGRGALVPESRVELILSQGPPDLLVTLVAGFSEAWTPFRNGYIVPDIGIIRFGEMTDPEGNLTVQWRWPGGVPSEAISYYQAFVMENGDLVGSNAVAARTP